MWSFLTYSCNDSVQEEVEGAVMIRISIFSVAQLCPTLCNPVDCSMPDFPVPHHFPKFCPSSCLLHQRYHLAISSFDVPPSALSRDFSNESAVLIRWPKYWSFSFRTSPRNEYSGLISLKFDWFDLIAVQGTFRSLLQHHTSKALIFLAFYLLYSPALTIYVITGKTQPWLYQPLSAE